MILQTARHQWALMCRAFAALPQPDRRVKRPLLVAGAAITVIVLALGTYALRGPAWDGHSPVARLAAPLAADRLAVTLSPPVAGADGPDLAHGPLVRPQSGPGTAAPRLASLAPPEGEGTRVSRLSRIFRGPPPVVPPARPAAPPLGATARSDGAVTGPLASALRPRARPQTAAQVPRTQQARAEQPAPLRPRMRPGDLAVASAPGSSSGAATGAASAGTGVSGGAPRLHAVLRPRLRPADLPVSSGRASTGATTVAARSAAPARANAPADPPRRQAALPAAPRIVRTSGRCPGRLSNEIPRRARNAAGASAVMAGLQSVDGVTRDRHVTREMLNGNMPDFLRTLRPVSIRGLAADGSTAVITLCVTPDYLALGSDADHARIPLGLRAATRIGDAFDMMLPTPRMVDLIHRGATVRLSPRPMPAGPQMTSTGYLMEHDATIDAQRRRAGAAPGTLISGHKKDVVLTTRLATMPGRVAIYGWHRANGQPIQPLSTVHGAGYADYSHGVRLVSRTAFLDGKPVDLRSLMASPLYAGLLSDEGPVTGPRLRMAALAAN